MDTSHGPSGTDSAFLELFLILLGRKSSHPSGSLSLQGRGGAGVQGQRKVGCVPDTRKASVWHSAVLGSLALIFHRPNLTGQSAASLQLLGTVLSSRDKVSFRAMSQIFLQRQAKGGE